MCWFSRINTGFNHVSKVGWLSGRSCARSIVLYDIQEEFFHGGGWVVNRNDFTTVVANEIRNPLLRFLGKPLGVNLRNVANFQKFLDFTHLA